MALGAAVAFLLAVPPEFTATSEILIDPRGTRTPASEDAGSPESAVVDSQVELIGSTAIASRVVEELQLDQDPEYALSTFGRWRASLSGADALPAVAKNVVVERFRRHLSVGRRGRSYMIEVRFTAHDASKAARIANAITDAYLSERTTAETDETNDGSNWPASRIAELRQAVHDAEAKLAAFKAGTTGTTTEGDGSSEDPSRDRIEAFGRQLATARTSAAAAKARYDRIRQLSTSSLDPGRLSDSLGSDTLADLRGQYAELTRREAEYSLTYLDGHPRMKTLRSQLADMRSRIKREIGRILIDARKAHETARARVGVLEANLKQLKAETTRTDTAEAGTSDAELRALEREVETSRRILDEFLERLSGTGAEPLPQEPEARIVSRALPPADADEPGPFSILLLATAGGLGLGLLGAAVADAADRSFRTCAELETVLGLTCFGLCPLLSPHDVRAALKARGGGSSDRALRRLAERPDGIAEALSRFVLLQPSSPFGEAVRGALRRLRSAGETGARRMPKVLVVSSATRNEGKSVIATNIASASAQSGALTLLVDADARDGALSALLVPDAECGLADVLDGTVPLEDAVSLDAESGLYLLPLACGEGHGLPAGVLDKERFNLFLDTHRDIFDVIVIDAPAILEVDAARALFKLADRALLVVEWGGTAREAVAAGLEGLQQQRRKIAGALLNKVDANSSNELWSGNLGS